VHDTAPKRALGFWAGSLALSITPATGRLGALRHHQFEKASFIVHEKMQLTTAI